MPFINTRDVGPVVLEIPPADEGAINGSVMNYWQAAIEDIGPAGVDEGKGGRFLILPPGYQDQVPDGYIPMPSDTYQDFALLRSVLQGGGDADVAQAVAYAERIQLYPLSRAASPPPTTFTDASQVVFDATIPYDLRFFQALDQMVPAEPWLDRDWVMIDQLRKSTGRSFQVPNATVPPGAPVTQYWSATVYDRRTHTFIRNAPGSAGRPRAPDSRPTPMGGSRSCSASMAPRSRCSTRPGGSPTSPGRPEERPRCAA
jgi:hypothetical protein